MLEALPNLPRSAAANPGIAGLAQAARRTGPSPGGMASDGGENEVRSRERLFCLVVRREARTDPYLCGFVDG